MVEIERDGNTAHLDYDGAGELAEELMDAKDELIAALHASPMMDDRITLRLCLGAVLEHDGTA